MRSNRFGVSALSVEDHDEALNEEIMLKKSTGTFYIKTPDGVVISYDKNSRDAAFINDLSVQALNHDVVGQMITIEPDCELPVVMNKDITLLYSPIALDLDNPVKKLLLAIDAEVLTGKKNNISHISGIEPLISCVINQYDDNYMEVLQSFEVKNKELSLFNSHVWDITRNITNKNIAISSLSIKKGKGEPDSSIIVLHGIYCVMEKR